MTKSITFKSVTTYSYTHEYEFKEREFEMMRAYYKCGTTEVEQATWDYLKDFTYEGFLKFFAERDWYRNEEDFEVVREDAYGNELSYNIVEEIEDWIAGWAESNSPEKKKCENWTEDFIINKR